jgi:hypothetical protein
MDRPIARWRFVMEAPHPSCASSSAKRESVGRFDGIDERFCRNRARLDPAHHRPFSLAN